LLLPEFLEERNERKEPGRKYRVGCRLSIALHPFVTDDSGQALDLPPNPALLSQRAGFGGQLLQTAKVAFDFVGRRSPFRSGVESGSEQLARLLLASAPLPRKPSLREHCRKSERNFTLFLRPRNWS